MNARNDVWSGDIENFVATLITLELIQRWVGLLNHGSHGAVSNDNAGSDSID